MKACRPSTGRKKKSWNSWGEQARRTEARLQEAIRSHRENLLQNEKLEEEYQKRKQQFQNSDTQRRSLMEQIQNLEQSLSRTDIEDLRGLLRQREEEAAEREVQRQSLQEQIEKKEGSAPSDGGGNFREAEAGPGIGLADRGRKKKSGRESGTDGAQKKDVGGPKAGIAYPDSSGGKGNRQAGRLVPEPGGRGLPPEAGAVCKKRMQVLKRAREQLDGELRLLNGLLPAGKQAGLFQYQKYFRDTMEQLETVLNQYQNAYCIVTHLF